MISYNLDSPRSSDEGGTWVSYYCPEKEPIVGQSSEWDNIWGFSWRNDSRTAESFGAQSLLAQLYLTYMEQWKSGRDFAGCCLYIVVIRSRRSNEAAT